MAWSRFRRVLALGGWLVLALLLAPGCAKEEFPKTYVVKGKAVFKNGKPFPGAELITFRLVTDPEQRAYGTIEKDGTFVLNTIALTSKARSARLPGAVEGEFLVNIRPGAGAGPLDPDDMPAGRQMMGIKLKKTYKIEAKEVNDITVIVE